MKNILRVGMHTDYRILLGVAVLLLPLTVFAQLDEAGIKSANISGRVTSGGQLKVVEQITYDLGEEKQKGFTRRLRIPSTGSVSVQSVNRDGLEEDYALTQAGQTKRIEIGDPEILLSGEHSYRIAYTVSGVAVSNDEDSLLRWTVMSRMDTAARNITVRVEPKRMVSAVTCRIGSTDLGCPVKRTTGGFTAFIDELPVDTPVTIGGNLSEDVAVTGKDDSQSWYGQYWRPLALLLLVIVIILVTNWQRLIGREGEAQSEEPDTYDKIDSLAE